MAATLKCDTIQNASSATANITLDTAGNATVGNTLAMGSSFLRNRIINGAMMIDQRNAGASVTASATSANTYTVDRWAYYTTVASKFTVQQTPSATETGYATRIGAGFTNYLALTSSSSYTVGSGDIMILRHAIEGLNVSDLAWGTSGAKTITLSFLAYSSVTGTHGGAICNNAGSRSYPFSYSIPVANTWTQISITVPGDTGGAGTWLTTNGVGLYLQMNVGTGATYQGTAGTWAGTFYASANGAVNIVATNGATFYITGVQLEVGSVATPFERRLYGQELALCQRYAYTVTSDNNGTGNNSFWGSTFFSGAGASIANIVFPVKMRATPGSILLSNTVGGYYVYVVNGGTYQATTGITWNSITCSSFGVLSVTTAAGGAAGQAGYILGDNTGNSRITFSAEL